KDSALQYQREWLTEWLRAVVASRRQRKSDVNAACATNVPPLARPCAARNDFPRRERRWQCQRQFSSNCAGFAGRNLTLFLECTVDDILQRDADAGAVGHRLRHENDEHVFLPVDPEGGAAGAGPVHLADGAFGLRNARFRAHGKAETEAEAGSR